MTSVARAVAHLGGDGNITQSPEEIAAAERVIFPGVGAAGAAMHSLARLGLDRVLLDALAVNKPVLGICVGTQVIFEHSEEENTTCLGVLPGQVVRFSPEARDEAGHPIKIPHMGWNSLQLRRPHPVLAGLAPEAEYYFVHSYHPEQVPEELVLATTFHGREFPSAVGRGSLVAFQFHLEKSGRPGLKILDNFLKWDGKEGGNAL